ncbi:MAG: hypothetical protein AAGA25_01850 [Planctomycetota bacterium]
MPDVAEPTEAEAPAEPEDAASVMAAQPDGPMDPELRLHYFDTLRKEILQVKDRLTRLIIVGLVGVPILTYFALSDDSTIPLLLFVSPLVVLLLVVLYFSEQASMMRAGTYIYDRIETTGEGWEHWVDELRGKHSEPGMFGLIVVLSVAYSLLMGGMALERLWTVNPDELTYFTYFLLMYAVPGIYALTFIWMFSTLFACWRRAFRTHG